MYDDLCIKCGKKLTNDDIGFHKKLVNRGATEYCCIECLADYYGFSLEKAAEMIENFKKNGCSLFC